MPHAPLFAALLLAAIGADAAEACSSVDPQAANRFCGDRTCPADPGHSCISAAERAYRREALLARHRHVATALHEGCLARR